MVWVRQAKILDSTLGDLLRRIVLEHLLPMYLIAELLDSLVVDEETVDSVKTGPMTEVSYMRYSALLGNITE